jgi:hemerythrin-like domain-containing protein
VLVRVAGQAHGGRLDDEQRIALETALRYFREAAPKHTADEEETLFPRLRSRKQPEIGEVLARVDALEHEHERADRSHAEIDRLGQKWLEQGELPADQAARLAALLADLTELYRAHIAVEESEVFPAASRVLGQPDRTAMGGEMAARRGLSKKGL